MKLQVSAFKKHSLENLILPYAALSVHKEFSIYFRVGVNYSQPLNRSGHRLLEKETSFHSRQQIKLKLFSPFQYGIRITERKLFTQKNIFKPGHNSQTCTHIKICVLTAKSLPLVFVYRYKYPWKELTFNSFIFS